LHYFFAVFILQNLFIAIIVDACAHSPQLKTRPL